MANLDDTSVWNFLESPERSQACRALDCTSNDSSNGTHIVTSSTMQTLILYRTITFSRSTNDIATNALKTELKRFIENIRKMNSKDVFAQFHRHLSVASTDQVIDDLANHFNQQSQKFLCIRDPKVLKVLKILRGYAEIRGLVHLQSYQPLRRSSTNSASRLRI